MSCVVGLFLECTDQRVMCGCLFFVCTSQRIMCSCLLKYFGPVMRNDNSLEKLIMLGNMQAKGKVVRQRMRWLEEQTTVFQRVGIL